MCVCTRDLLSWAGAIYGAKEAPTYKVGIFLYPKNVFFFQDHCVFFQNVTFLVLPEEG